MNIRRAVRTDIPAILSIANQNIMAAQWRAQEYEQALENVAARRLVLVAAADSNVVGFLVARAIDSEWELENIAVTPERHRKGVGQALLWALIDIARHHAGEAIFLEVRESNSAARTLYERCGFQASGTRPGYYSAPVEDAALYRFLCSSESLENR
jgi:ribosomal-protein-alanine N-acetyltransferase